jgi:CheY-like chemotaxis protein
MTSVRNYDRTPDLTVQARRAPASSNTVNACVLVVEDHEDTRFLLRMYLERRGGISVIEAENGEMAIALAKNVHVNLILMDADLPVLDGYAATRRIRELTPAHEIPIIFMSGHAQPAAEAKAFAAGGNEYIVKPFALVTLDSVLERYLAQAKEK